MTRVLRRCSVCAQQVEVQDLEGASHFGEIVSLPFYDADKNIPRGLDRTIPDIPD